MNTRCASRSGIHWSWISGLLATSSSGSVSRRGTSRARNSSSPWFSTTVMSQSGGRRAHDRHSAGEARGVDDVGPAHELDQLAAYR